MLNQKNASAADFKDANTPCVVAKNLKVGYPNGVIVSDINFELRPGQAMAFIGTNGSGKSTLLRTVVGLLPPAGGQISVFGAPPGNNHVRIAYLGQFHSSGMVLPIRTIDVVRMGLFPSRGLWRRMSRQDEETVLSAMQTMGIEKLANAPLRSLSGGQQQRAYLAQVLAHHADLLLLDEPTAGLDAGGRELYLRAINDEICRGAAICVATHDIHEEAAMCHQVLLLARRVVALGPPQQVLTPEALLDTFGVLVTSNHKTLHVLECAPGHEDIEHMGINRPGR